MFIKSPLMIYVLQVSYIVTMFFQFSHPPPMLRMLVYIDAGPQPPESNQFSQFQDGNKNQLGVCELLEWGMEKGLKKFFSQTIQLSLIFLYTHDFMVTGLISRLTNFQKRWLLFIIRIIPQALAYMIELAIHYLVFSH